MSPIRTTQCGHNFCEKCLIDISNNDQNWACPECRREHHCPIKSLPRNFLIEKMVDKFKQQQEKTSKPRSEFGSCQKHSRAIEIRKFHCGFSL